MLDTAHLEKILSSSTFHSSESLQKLLSYLADHSVSDPPRPVKEYQIATEVLGRGPQFDPRMDSSVRVNVARLRSKLLEYYATEGKDDPLRIEIPKGSYVVLFQEHTESGQSHETDAAEPSEVEQAAQQSRPGPPRIGAIAATLAAGLALGALATLWMNPSTVSQGSSPNTVLESFWGGFNQPGEKTIVVFSNARFVGDSETGLRYFNPDRDRLEDVRDLHTGVGEVVGVYELSRVFRELGAALEVKRAALVDWDEVKKANVVFVGGPAENMPVRELRQDARFVFETYTDTDGEQRVVVVNRGSGDSPPERFDTGMSRPLRQDYAIIRLLPGLVPGRRILILAGISTLGTQAAVEFVCRPDTVQTLLAKLAEYGSGDPQGFECILEVSINGGVPVDSQMVAFHAIAAHPAELSSAE